MLTRFFVGKSSKKSSQKVDNTVFPEVESCPLRIGDAVLPVTSKRNRSHGVVKWIGRLPDSADVFVGVEFADAVGTGSGFYKGKRFFDAKNLHGGFYPLTTLMKVDDYYQGQTSDFATSHHSDMNGADSYSYLNTQLLPEKIADYNGYSNGDGKTSSSYSLRSNSVLTDSAQRTPSLSYPPEYSSSSRHHSLISADGDLLLGKTRRDRSVPSTPSDALSVRLLDDSNQLVQERFCSAKANVELRSKYSPSSPVSDWPTTSGMRPVKTEWPQGLPGSANGELNNNLLQKFSDTNLKDSNCTNNAIEIGSAVEVLWNDAPLFGVVRWVGDLVLPSGSTRMAGLELDDPHPAADDGTYNGKFYFHCPERKGLFVSVSILKRDSRLTDDYGIPGIIPPVTHIDIHSTFGRCRGIQGHNNSCYLDATLFSMFAFTSVFDSLLYRPQTEDDISQYSEVQHVLCNEIVNPLRKNMYVKAHSVMKLRVLLEKLSSVRGLTSEEKDPEEFLHCLLSQILKAKPYLKLNSGQEAYHYQLFVEKDERLRFPTVQQLFEQSFFASNLKLKEVPSCLIIQMPRFGKAYKMYPRIVPSQYLDVTDIIENSPRQCFSCGDAADYECRDCYGKIGSGLDSIAFCEKCSAKIHRHNKRVDHKPQQLKMPCEFQDLKTVTGIPRLYMELFAVLCIETSHYVAFVKCSSGPDGHWCFFDSMADRRGEANGYNIPATAHCPDLPNWISEDGSKVFEHKEDRQLGEHARRLFCDAYMCMYRSTDVSMYK